MSFEKLPKEIIVKIIGLVSRNDRKNMALVSQQMYGIIAEVDVFSLILDPERFTDVEGYNFLMETTRSFLHITLQNINCKLQNRDALERLFQCFTKFAPCARGLLIDCNLKALEYLIILSVTKKIEKLEIRNGFSGEASSCQTLLPLNRHVMQRLNLRELKVERCDELIAEILLMLRANTVVDLDAEEFPVVQLQQFIAAQSSICFLRIVYSMIDNEDLKMFDKIARNLQLTKLSLYLDFINRDDPNIETIIAEIIISQPNLTHLDLRVPSAGQKIIAAITKLQPKTLVMQVSGKVLGDTRMLFKSMKLESLTLYGPRRSCRSFFAIKDEFAKPTLKKFAYTFLD